MSSGCPSLGNLRRAECHRSKALTRFRPRSCLPRDQLRSNRRHPCNKQSLRGSIGATRLKRPPSRRWQLLLPVVARSPSPGHLRSPGPRVVGPAIPIRCRSRSHRRCSVTLFHRLSPRSSRSWHPELQLAAAPHRKANTQVDRNTIESLLADDGAAVG